MWTRFLNSRFRLRRLRSQLILTFLTGFLGIAFAIGLPMIVLINRQASSQAQILSSLGDYLNTLREGANLDFVLVCSDGKDVTDSAQTISVAELCLENS